MSITKEQVRQLRPGDRVEMLHPGAPEGTEPAELTLWEDEGGYLRTSAGTAVRWHDGTPSPSAMAWITRISPRPFEPRRGLVVGDPDFKQYRLVCLGEGEWVGRGPRWNRGISWYSDSQVREYVTQWDWVVIDDLTQPQGSTES